MRILFMGTPDFASVSLKALLDNRIEVCGVFTQPDKKVGRKQILTPSDVKKLAQEYNLKIYQPERIKNSEYVEIIKQINPDVIVVVAYGQILSEEILNIPKYGCINVHGSLLPKYRGAGPIQWAIINGESVTGVTTMFMAKGMDTGDIILKREISILDQDNAETLFNKMADLGAKTLIETLELIKNGTAKRKKQCDDCATYAPMLSRETAFIDFSKTAREIFNLVRGTNPWPVASCIINNKTVKIYECKEVKLDNFNYIYGEVISSNNEKRLIIACKDSAIEILSLKPEGKKIMSAKDYLQGNKIEKGIIIKS